MKTLVCLLLLGSPLFGQAVSAVQNTPVTIIPVSTPVGTTISATGMTAGASALSICGTVADPTNPLTPDPCPAGLYRLDVSIETLTAGTLVSALTASVNYTTDVRSYTTTIISSYSLLGTTTPGYGYVFFRKAANTAISLTTTTTTLTGNPTYNMYARVLRIP